LYKARMDLLGRDVLDGGESRSIGEPSSMGEPSSKARTHRFLYEYRRYAPQPQQACPAGS
jgi:hypothetical protein